MINSGNDVADNLLSSFVTLLETNGTEVAATGLVNLVSGINHLYLGPKLSAVSVFEFG